VGKFPKKVKLGLYPEPALGIGKLNEKLPEARGILVVLFCEKGFYIYAHGSWSFTDFVEFIEKFLKDGYGLKVEALVTSPLLKGGYVA